MSRFIYGVGTDILELTRIEAVLKHGRGQKFLQRILTDKERELCEERKSRLPEFAGGRFSAKEAIAKALGTGIGATVSFLDIEILPDSFGKPLCTLSSASIERLHLPSQPLIHLSISHSERYAVSFAMVECEM